MTPGDLQSTNGLTVASTRAARRDQHDSGHDGNARRYRHQPRRHVPRREVVLGRRSEVLLYDGNLDAADISALETYLIDKSASTFA
jgi:hypothetical protein